MASRGWAIPAGAARQIGDDQRADDAEDPGADAVFELDADQGIRAGRHRVADPADQQDGEPGEEDRPTGRSGPRVLARAGTNSTLLGEHHRPGSWRPGSGAHRDTFGR
jgi:hypothetical protein